MQSSSPKTSVLVDEILNFVRNSAGLNFEAKGDNVIMVHQSVDGKTFKFSSSDVSEVLPRKDSDGKNFIQINFTNGTKVLFTDSLVGFKPRETVGLDMGKLPRVVTTPDLASVFEALEESMSADFPSEQEIELLKKVYHSILMGGELAGFDLRSEKKWLSRLFTHHLRASA